MSAAVRHLVSSEVYQAYRKARPVPPDRFPPGPELKRLRQAAGVDRATFAALVPSSWELLAKYEQGGVRTSGVLTGSRTCRRLVAAFAALAEGVAA